MELCFGNKNDYCEVLKNIGTKWRVCDNPQECCFYKTQKQYEDDREKAARDYERRIGRK